LIFLHFLFDFNDIIMALNFMANIIIEFIKNFDFWVFQINFQKIIYEIRHDFETLDLLIDFIFY
jgi:hypothetical protein